MTLAKPTTLCLTPRVSGVGGMVSFRHKLTAGLEARHITVTHDLQDPNASAILVIGGTRQLAGLHKAKRRGIPIAQRLNGMNWLHRKRFTGLRHFIRAEYGNLILNYIRTRLASQIIYQSAFARDWWERVRGPTPVPSHVIHNGVDLAAYNPQGAHTRPKNRYRVLLVEGNLAGGYETGLETAVKLATLLGLSRTIKKKVDLMVVGKVSPKTQAWAECFPLPIQWTGLVPREQIPAIDRSAHLLYSADLNAACPNAVIEALACGLPVVAYDTGALPELVPPNAGRVVPYGGDPWALDTPDLAVLVKGAAEILTGRASWRKAARRRAEQAFGLEEMVEKYLQVVV